MEKIADGVKYVAVPEEIAQSCTGCVAQGRSLCSYMGSGCMPGRIIWKRSEAFDRAQPDTVNHPPHYTQHPSGIECIQITEHMGFNLGNAVKYIWRADLKDNAIEDLKKARWYIDRELKRRGAEETTK